MTGGDDSKIVVWFNDTQLVQEKESFKREEMIQNEQTIQNLLHRKSWFKALKVAIRLGHPLRALTVLREILLEEGSIKSVIDKLGQLRDDQLLTLFEYAVHWNTNSKNYLLAQCVVRAVLEHFPPEDLLQISDFRSKVERMLPYNERHITRVAKLAQYAHFADFVYENMKLPDLIQ